MAEGRQTATKRKTDEKDEAAPAINEPKAAASSEKKNKNYKPDQVLRIKYPEATVYEDYSCMLNQTNIDHNNNKFYVIQIVQDKKTFICFTRWGRVGKEGQHNDAVEKDAEAAIKSFKKKFKDKTKNDWEKRENFTPHPGKYTMIEIDDDQDADERVDTVDGAHQITRTTETLTGTCLPNARTMLMIKIIFSDDMFINQMSAMDLDNKKMPLGKLSKVQIAKGLEVLQDIEDAIKNNKPRQELMDLSSKFYTNCPHDFGHKVPPVLDKESIVQQKKEVMLTLSDIELTQSLQKEKPGKEIHLLLEKYQTLECEMDLLDKNSEEYKLLHEYSSACPNSRRGTLLDIWRIDRKGEKERFQEHENIKNRKLLWHGTNIAAVAAILKAGLRIMPQPGPFGRGICFTSEHAKSCCYAQPHNGVFESEKNVAFMFLVEVALGKEKSITAGDSSLTRAPPGFDSVVARGSCEPDPKKNKIIVLDGKEVIVPLGKPVPQEEWSQSDFCQSEYLVYKESQTKLRYMLKFSFE